VSNFHPTGYSGQKRKVKSLSEDGGLPVKQGRAIGRWRTGGDGQKPEGFVSVIGEQSNIC
jgi:hypothetical protein